MYYENSENEYLIRVENVNEYKTSLTYLTLENMSDYTINYYDIEPTYTPFEQKLNFNLDLGSDTLKVGEQYLIKIYYDENIIYRGSLSVYENEQSDKKDYETKLFNNIKSDGDDYIVLEN